MGFKKPKDYAHYNSYDLGRSIFRLHLTKDNSRIVYAERMFIGERIRDMIVDNKGIVYLVTDKPEIIKLDRTFQ